MMMMMMMTMTMTMMMMMVMLMMMMIMTMMIARISLSSYILSLQKWISADMKTQLHHPTL